MKKKKLNKQNFNKIISNIISIIILCLTLQYKIKNIRRTNIILNSIVGLKIDFFFVWCGKLFPRQIEQVRGQGYNFLPSKAGKLPRSDADCEGIELISSFVIQNHKTRQI